MRSVAGPEIERLIQLLARLPGLGPRSARRAALHLIRKREQLLAPARRGDADVARARRHLSRSAAMSTRAIPARSARIRGAIRRLLVVVESVSDLWALERSGAVRARYHVLGGTLVAARRRRP